MSIITKPCLKGWYYWQVLVVRTFLLRGSIIADESGIAVLVTPDFVVYYYLVYLCMCRSVEPFKKVDLPSPHPPTCTSIHIRVYGITPTSRTAYVYRTYIISILRNRLLNKKTWAKKVFPLFRRPRKESGGRGKSGARQVGVAAWLECWLSHLGVAGSSPGRDNLWKPLGE